MCGVELYLSLAGNNLISVLFFLYTFSPLFYLLLHLINGAYLFGSLVLIIITNFGTFIKIYQCCFIFLFFSFAYLILSKAPNISCTSSVERLPHILSASLCREANIIVPVRSHHNREKW